VVGNKKESTTEKEKALDSTRKIKSGARRAKFNQEHEKRRRRRNPQEKVSRAQSRNGSKTIGKTGTMCGSPNRKQLLQ